jgi:hypothetical protein
MIHREVVQNMGAVLKIRALHTPPQHTQYLAHLPMSTQEARFGSQRRSCPDLQLFPLNGNPSALPALLALWCE